MADEVVKLPLEHPCSSTSIPTVSALTADESAKYESLLSTASSWTHVHSKPLADSEKDAAQITASERMFMTKECLLRYLRASKWDVKSAEKRLMATLLWRREYGAETFTAEYISPENETGKQVIFGYDLAGRPCLYMRPRYQNTTRTPRQIHMVVFMLESILALLPPGVEKVLFLIDFTKMSQGQGASLGQGREVVNILQNHYPERLGKACMNALPWYIWAFMKVITPLLDPVTREKVSYEKPIRESIPPEQLMKEYGGDVNFEYDHAVYWPAFEKLVLERKQQQRERWEKAGSKVGELEFYLLGGSEETSKSSENSNPNGMEKKQEVSETQGAEQTAETTATA